MGGSTLERHVAYSATQMFDLVLDVERYREFMPFGFGARVLSRGVDAMQSVQHLNVGPFHLQFETHARYFRPDWVEVRSDSDAFRRFILDWRFGDVDRGCDIRVTADCVPNSLLLAAFLRPWTGSFAGSLVSAFERRAKAIYG